MISVRKKSNHNHHDLTPKNIVMVSVLLCFSSAAKKPL